MSAPVAKRSAAPPARRETKGSYRDGVVSDPRDASVVVEAGPLLSAQAGSSRATDSILAAGTVPGVEPGGAEMLTGTLSSRPGAPACVQRSS